jgi:peroxiredoxin Q/BCP
VAGCSVDSLEDQKAFATKLSLRFPLIADADGSICRAYDVMHETMPLAGRRSVVIAPDGTILKAYPAARARGHAEQVLNDLRELLG